VSLESVVGGEERVSGKAHRLGQKLTNWERTPGSASNGLTVTLSQGRRQTGELLEPNLPFANSNLSSLSLLSGALSTRRALIDIPLNTSPQILKPRRLPASRSSGSWRVL
jgi:hypothetical protein